MKIKRKHLIDALTKARQVSDPRGTMPLLAHALFSVDGTLAATDLRRSFSTKLDIEGEIGRPFSAEISGLLERVKAMPEGDVSLALTDSHVVIKSGKRSFKFHCYPGEEFPALPDVPETFAPAPELQSRIQSVLSASSLDETRQHLTSVLIDGDVTVATDGHRCHVVRSTDKLPTVLLPRNAAEVIAKIDGALELAVTDTRLFLRNGDGNVYGFTLTDALFPPWEQVVKSDTHKSVTVDRDALKSVFSAAILAIEKRANGVQVTVNGDQLTVSASSPEKGEFSETLDCSGDVKGTFAVSAQYAIEALDQCDTEVKMLLGGELDPIFFTSESFTGCIMPMRI